MVLDLKGRVGCSSNAESKEVNKGSRVLQKFWRDSVSGFEEERFVRKLSKVRRESERDVERERERAKNEDGFDSVVLCGEVK